MLFALIRKMKEQKKYVEQIAKMVEKIIMSEKNNIGNGDVIINIVINTQTEEGKLLQLLEEEIGDQQHFWNQLFGLDLKCTVSFKQIADKGISWFTCVADLFKQ